MIGLPPFDAGAVHESATDASPAVPTTPVGAPGAVAAAAGVIAADAAESAPVPMPLIAATLNVYAVPLVRPVTLRVVAFEPVTIAVCAVAPMYGVIR